MLRQALLALFAIWSCVACSSRSETCLAGSASCEEAAMCERLRFSCAGGALFVGRLADLPGGLDLRDAEGTGGDIVLQNDAITVVIDALDQPHDLAPTGGNIIDMGARGGKDDLVLLYQIAGILPEDAFAYSSVEFVDRSPELVAVVVRGQLDGRADIEVVTRYELRACEPGLRVRTEMRNGSPDPHVMTIADSGHWGKRNLLPFAPSAGQGFAHEGFGLLSLQDEYAGFDYVMARAAEDDAPSYGLVSCDRKQLQGVNSTELSALGTGISMLRPGEEWSYQRYLQVSESRDLSEVTKRLATARRQLHGEARPVFVSGDISAGALPLAGDMRRATVQISEIVGDDLRRPLTTVIPNSKGHFRTAVPSQSWLYYEVWSFGRVLAEGVVPRAAPAEEASIGTIEIEMPARLSVAVTGNGEPSLASLFVSPADEDERERLAGTWLGEFRECSPWLGSPVGASPACNVVNVEPQGNDFELPAGRYQLWFTMGPEWTLGRKDIEIAAGEVQSVEVDLEHLDVAPLGWLSADLHVHGSASFDSSLPDLDRVRTFVAHGVQVIAATDHDAVVDYADAVETLGLGDRVEVLGGLETTQLIPHMKVPGSDFPKVIGHFNHWPMTPDTDAPRGGAPWDELVEAKELYELMDPLLGDEGIHMLNHPWDQPQFGRDLGFFRAIGFDPRDVIPEKDDGSANGFLLRATPSGTRNIDFDLIEVQNGASAVQALETRPLWFSLLSQGHVRAGVGNSDSHELHERLGFGRSYVDASMNLENFDVGLFNRALKGGKVIGSNGVVVTVDVGQESGQRRGLGFDPYTPQAGDTLRIEVRAPPWVPVDELRLVTHTGVKVIASGEDLEHPIDPLGNEGVLRYRAAIPLDSVLTEGVDTWLVVEAGMRFQPVADLDDDGVLDTSDNNQDGVVDERDIEDDDDESGPLATPPDPIDADDPRYALTRVLPGAWPYGFTNAILIDWQGDGWQAPGLQP